MSYEVEVPFSDIGFSFDSSMGLDVSHVASGGYGEKVRAFVDEQELDTEVLTVAIPDEFVEHGNVDILKKEVGIDAETVVNRVMAVYAEL